jgi:hypothetical protein
MYIIDYIILYFYIFSHNHNITNKLNFIKNAGKNKKRQFWRYLLNEDFFNLHGSEESPKR